MSHIGHTSSSLLLFSFLQHDLWRSISYLFVRALDFITPRFWASSLNKKSTCQSTLGSSTLVVGVGNDFVLVQTPFFACLFFTQHSFQCSSIRSLGNSILQYGHSMGKKAHTPGWVSKSLNLIGKLQWTQGNISSSLSACFCWFLTNSWSFLDMCNCDLNMFQSTGLILSLPVQNQTWSLQLLTLIFFLQFPHQITVYGFLLCYMILRSIIF